MNFKRLCLEVQDQMEKLLISWQILSLCSYTRKNISFFCKLQEISFRYASYIGYEKMFLYDDKNMSYLILHEVKKCTIILISKLKVCQA